MVIGRFLSFFFLFFSLSYSFVPLHISCFYICLLFRIPRWEILHGFSSQVMYF